MPLLRFFSLVCIFILPYPALSQPAVQRAVKIQKIEIHSTADQERIQLAFDSDFHETISPHFDTGLVRITLPTTIYNPGLETVHINNRFLRIVRLYQEGKNTIVEIQFSDSEFLAIGKVSSQIEGQQLFIDIDKTAKSNNKSIEDSPLFAGTADKKDVQPLTFNKEMLENSDITVNIIKMLLAVAAILLFFYGILWIYNRFFVSRFSFKKGNHTIRLVSSYHISPKQKIVILDVDNTSFACGVTPTSINLISEVSGNSFYNYLAQLKPDHKKGVDFSRLRTQYLETRSAKSDENSMKNKSSFAAELLIKVKKLKPID
jgi:flagellar biogenesis protein FliO